MEKLTNEVRYWSCMLASAMQLDGPRPKGKSHLGYEGPCKRSVTNDPGFKAFAMGHLHLLDGDWKNSAEWRNHEALIKRVFFGGVSS